MMPTNRPRYMITETDDLSNALTVAAELWPESQGDKGRLLRRVLEAGIDTVKQVQTDHRASRLAFVEQASGSLTGIWPSGWRQELRDEWPE